jgi:hypothetical protein
MRQTISNIKNRDINMKTSLKTLSFIFILAFLSSSLHAQQTTTVVRVVDGVEILEVDYNLTTMGERSV